LHARGSCYHESLRNVSDIGAPTEERFSRGDLTCAAVSILILIWINLYICRELFFREAAHMNSMHGFWTALARIGPGSWFRSTWWPFWDCGIPLEYTYAPLVPALTAAVAAVRGAPHAVAFQSVSGFFYCLVPVTLFLMVWLLTRAPAYGFVAGLLYSLTSPTQVIVPDTTFSFSGFLEARRFYLAAVWDETPHLAALAFLPLIILFLSLSIRKRRLVYYVASAVSISLASLASAFGPMMAAMAALCLLSVLRREDYKRNFGIILSIGPFAYALSAPFLAPSLLLAMRDSSITNEGGWSAGSLMALAMVVLGFVFLSSYLPRRTADWRLHFFALFAYLTTSVPCVAVFLHRQFLPQSTRYKVEMELALAAFAAVAMKKWLDKTPMAARAALLCLALAIAGVQVVSHRRSAKSMMGSPAELKKTIEYRASRWVEANLPGVRVMMPGSAAQWANSFTDIRQFSGSSWSMACNRIRVRAMWDVFNGGATPERDARVSLAWLKAYGVGAIGISGPHSTEFWKPFAQPTKFAGALPVLWSEDDVTIYRIPRRTESLAHVVAESALVSARGNEIPGLAAIEQYVAALEDPSLPVAALEWQDRSGIRIRTEATAGQVISVQLTYHPGWHVQVNGQARAVERDGLGLMWIRPGCNGPCEVQLDYDGGWELRICRYLSFAAIGGLLALPFLARIIRYRIIFRGGWKTPESASN
ncbi:MAG: hypothetical protein JWO48_3104, partial [Bryobacterales bacterium]|nr:hypothetical protein [Bryobacterales bacterium]